MPEQSHIEQVEEASKKHAEACRRADGAIKRATEFVRQRGITIGAEVFGGLRLDHNEVKVFNIDPKSLADVPGNFEYRLGLALSHARSKARIDVVVGTFRDGELMGWGGYSWGTASRHWRMASFDLLPQLLAEITKQHAEYVASATSHVDETINAVDAALGSFMDIDSDDEN